MACNDALPLATLKDGTYDVVSKFKTLTEEALGTESIYMRAKDTFKELLDGKRISEAEYAALAGQFVSQLAVATTQQVMQGALQWAQTEKEMVYSLAQAEANIELAQAQREKIKAEICKLEKDTEFQCASIKAAVATSIRRNGRVLTYEADGCTPATLAEEGTELAQLKLLEAQKYNALADTYRKSGVVQIGIDVDSKEKGLSGNNMGYTDAQEEYARRQILSFEDSKRTHAANAISQMIGQMLATEIAPSADYKLKWDAALDYLITNTPTV